MTIMNDWSARALQMEEMKLNLGPAKGKDFATSLGPWLVTIDELASRGHAQKTDRGTAFDLGMRASVNGRELSRGNVKDMNLTFAQILERASYGVTLDPGDVIGSGTCGTGCLLELNGSKITDRTCGSRRAIRWSSRSTVWAGSRTAIVLDAVDPNQRTSAMRYVPCRR